MSSGLQFPDRSLFGLILIANSLPIAGLLVLDWHVYEALFVYWVELGLFVTLYSGLALFAQREATADDRTITPPTISVPFVSSREGSTRPIGRLPPIYYRNVRYVIGMLVFGLAFWFLLSYLFVVLPYPGPLHVRPSVQVVISRIEAASSPARLALAIPLFLAHLAVVRREFFGRRQYERRSAPTIAEIPIRYVLFWLVLSVGTTIVLPVGMWAFDELGIPTSNGTTAIAAVVVGAKLAIEWSQFRARQRDEPAGMARWLTPETPESG